MKKFALVVFSLMFVGVAFVGAQDVKVSFDGENAIQNGQAMEKFSMPEAFSDIEYSIPVPKRDVKFKTEKEEIPTTAIYKIDTQKLQKLRRKILKESGLLKDEKALRLIEDEKTIILYNNENIFFTNDIGENRYNMIWKSSNKQLVKHLANKENQIMTIGAINKYGAFVKKCWDVISFITTLVGTVEIITEVKERMCKMEWVPDENNNSGIGTDGLHQWHAKGTINIKI